MGVGRYIGGSHQSDQPRGRGGADEEGREAIATGMPGPEGAMRRRERLAWVIFFVDDVITVEVQWREAFTASLEDVHFSAKGERAGGEEPLLPRKKMTGWATAQEVLGLWLDTEDMTVGRPLRKLEDLRQRLAKWPPERREATVREVLSLAGKLHHAEYRTLISGRHSTVTLLGGHSNEAQRKLANSEWKNISKTKRKRYKERKR